MTEDNVGQGKFIATNGIEIYYEDHGVGHPLVLLHGGTGTGSSNCEISGPVKQCSLQESEYRTDGESIVELRGSEIRMEADEDAT